MKRWFSDVLLWFDSINENNSCVTAIRFPGGNSICGLDQTHRADVSGFLRYRLAGAHISTGLLLEKGADESFFLLMVQPPERVRAGEIAPRELVFILDVSGSMHGFPLDTAKALMRDLLPRLRPVDRFNVVFFSGGSFVLSPEVSLSASPENVKKALDTFDHLQGGGGTELLQALQTGYGLPISTYDGVFSVP